MHVEFDDTRGEVRAAGARAPLAAAGRPGTVQVGGPGGPVLRPVTFAERSAAVAAALASTDPVDALCAALRTRATVRAGELGERMLDLVVLALAGAENEYAPSFAATAAAVVRATGARLDSVLAAPAREVDRLAGPAATAPDDGWTRVTFGPAAPDDLREDLARRLLRRAAPEALAPGEATSGALDHAAGSRPRDDSTSSPTMSRASARMGDRPAAVAGAHDLVGPELHEVADVAAHEIAGPAASELAGAAAHEPTGLAAHEIAGSVAHELVGAASDAVAGVAANDRSGSATADDPIGASLEPAAANDREIVTRPIALDRRRTTSRLLAARRDPAPASSHYTWAAGAPEPIRHDPAPVPRGRDDRVELDVADTLARALHDEADLRGLAR